MAIYNLKTLSSAALLLASVLLPSFAKSCPPDYRAKKVQEVFYPSLSITNRTYEEFEKMNFLYVPQISQIKSKVVLDIGSGPEAILVKKLRQLGVDAKAIDPKIVNPDSAITFHGLSNQIPFRDESVDYALTSFSVLSSVGLTVGKSEALVKASLIEMERVLRAGGRVHILDVHDTQFRQIYEPILTKLDRFKIIKTPNKPFTEKFPLLVLEKKPRDLPRETEKIFHPTNRDYARLQLENPNYILPFQTMKNKKVLDLGSGPTGELVKDLRKEGIDAIGVDRLVKPNSRIPFLLSGSIENLPIQTGSIDYAYSSWSVMSPLYAPNVTKESMVTYLKEIHRVLKTGGELRIYPVTTETIDLHLSPAL